MDTLEHREKIYYKALETMPFDGCNTTSIALAAQKLGLPEAYAKIYFPGGIEELLDQYFELLIQKLCNETTASESISSTISDFISNFITQLQNERLLNRTIITFLCQPKNAIYMSKKMWYIAKAAWRLTPDRAVDFSYYSKRVTLVAIISSTLLYWLKDQSDEAADTQAFFKQRMQNLADFHSLKSRFSHYVPKPFTN